MRWTPGKHNNVNKSPFYWAEEEEMGGAQEFHFDVSRKTQGQLWPQAASVFAPSSFPRCEVPP